MRRILTVGLIIFCTVACPVFAKDRALIIGVGKYDISEANLPGIDKDLDRMRLVAKAMGFTDDQIMVVPEEETTLAGIIAAIKRWLIQDLKPGDKGLLYITGHGCQIEDQNGDESDGVDEVLAARDTRVVGRTLENVLVDDQLESLLKQIRSDNLIILIDACYSGTATKAAGIFSNEKEKFFPFKCLMTRFKQKDTVENDPSVNYAALSAAQDDEAAVATPEGSLFTRGVFEAVTRADQDRKDLTLRQLKEKSAQYIKSHTSPGRVHTPNLTGNPSLMDKTLLVREAPDSQMWQRMNYLVNNANYPVGMSVASNRIKVGDLLVIQCRIPCDGYLNIIEVGETDKEPTVLFPNQYHPDNYVRKGREVKIPSSEFSGRFNLRAKMPGRSLLVALVTEEPLNAYHEGTGDKDFFRTMSENSLTKALFAVEKSRGLGAGSIIARVE